MQIDLAFSCVQFSRSLVLTGLDTSPSLYIGFSENRVGNFLFINMFRIFSIHGKFGPLFGPTSIQYSQGDLLSSYCGVLGLFWEATLWTSKSQQTGHLLVWVMWRQILQVLQWNVHECLRVCISMCQIC